MLRPKTNDNMSHRGPGSVTLSHPNDLMQLYPASSWRPVWCGESSSTRDADVTKGSTTLPTSTPEVRIPIYQLLSKSFKLRIQEDNDTCRFFGSAGSDYDIIKHIILQSDDTCTLEVAENGATLEIRMNRDRAHFGSSAYCLVHANSTELRVVAATDKAAVDLIAEVKKALMQGTNHLTDVLVEDQQPLGRFMCANLPAKFQFQDLRVLNILTKPISTVFKQEKNGKCVEMNVHDICKSLVWGVDPFAVSARKRLEKHSKTMLTVFMDGRLEMHVDCDEDQKIYEKLFDVIIPALMQKALKPIPPSVVTPNSKTAEVATDLTSRLVEKLHAAMKLPVAPSSKAGSKNASKPPVIVPPSVVRHASCAPRDVGPSTACIRPPALTTRNVETPLVDLPPLIEEIPADKGRTSRAKSAAPPSKVIQEINPQANIRTKRMAPVLKSIPAREKASMVAESAHAKPSSLSRCGTGGMGGRPHMATRLNDKVDSKKQQHTSPAQKSASASSSVSSDSSRSQNSSSSSSSSDDDSHGSTSRSVTSSPQPANKRNSAVKPKASTHEQRASVSSMSSAASRLTSTVGNAAGSSSRNVNDAQMPESRTNTALPSSLLNSPESSPPSMIARDNGALTNLREKRPVAANATQPASTRSRPYNEKMVALFGDDHDDDDDEDAAPSEIVAGGGAPVAGQSAVTDRIATASNDFEFMGLGDSDAVCGEPSQAEPSVPAAAAAGKKSSEVVPSAVGETSAAVRADSKRQRVNSSSRAVAADGKRIPVKQQHAGTTGPLRAAVRTTSQARNNPDDSGSIASISTQKSSRKPKSSTSRSQPPSIASTSNVNLRKRRVRLESDDDTDSKSVAEKPKSKRCSSPKPVDSRVQVATKIKRNWLKNTVQKRVYMPMLPVDESITTYTEPAEDENDIINREIEFCYPDNEERFNMHIKRSIRFLRSRKHPNPNPKRPEPESDAGGKTSAVQEESKKYKKRRKQRDSGSSKENNADEDGNAEKISAIADSGVDGC